MLRTMLRILLHSVPIRLASLIVIMISYAEESRAQGLIQICPGNSEADLLMGLEDCGDYLIEWNVRTAPGADGCKECTGHMDWQIYLDEDGDGQPDDPVPVATGSWAGTIYCTISVSHQKELDVICLENNKTWLKLRCVCKPCVFIYKES